MAAIVSNNFRVVNANNFKEDVANNAVYVAIGKPDVWSNSTADTTDAASADTPNDHLDDIGEARAQMIALKEVVSGDLSHVVPRHTWTSGNSYYEWDSNDGSIFDKAFYVVTSEFKVYKCIKAGGGASTQQPTQTLTDPQAESDGYSWKYMYTISVTDAEKFLTNSYMPVKTVSLGTQAEVAVAQSSAGTALLLKETNPGIAVGMTVSGTNVGSGKKVSAINGSQITLSGATSSAVAANTVLTFAYAANADAEANLNEADYNQYLNQKASRDSSTAAGIERIEVTANGTGYTGTPTVAITGDGTGATATVVKSGNTVSAINITNKGTNYTFADVVISGGSGSDATARAVISPKEGHGVDPKSELGGFFMGLNVKLDGAAGAGDITVGNDFRQIMLLKNPRDYNATPLAGAIASADTLKAMNKLDFKASFASGSNVTSFTIDEVITGTTSGAKAFVVETDNTSNSGAGYVFYTQNAKTGYGNFTDGETVTGALSGTQGSLEGTLATSGSSLGDNFGTGDLPAEVDRMSGQVLFLENRLPILRSATQIEDIKVILEF